MTDEAAARLRLGEYLRGHRIRHGGKLEVFARRARLSDSYLSRIERGEYKGRITAEALEKIAHAYDLDLGNLQSILAGGLPAPPPVPRSVEELLDQARMIAPIAIPVVEHPAHAGHGGTVAMDVIYAERAFAVNKDLVCVPVKGECMTPDIKPGDRVIVDRDASPHPGDVVLVVVEEEIVVRRFYKTNMNFILRADNREFTDIEADAVQIIGVVVEIRRRP